jgi:DNA-binding NtrC family response regulator
LDEVCQESGKAIKRFNDEALAALQAYRWPGNVRELQNVIERAVLLSKRDVLGLEDLPPLLAAAGPVPVEPVGDRGLKQALEVPERQIILDALRSNGWNRQTTAEALGINRTTLYKKMRRLGLEEPRYALPR